MRAPVVLRQLLSLSLKARLCTIKGLVGVVPMSPQPMQDIDNDIDCCFLDQCDHSVPGPPRVRMLAAVIAQQGLRPIHTSAPGVPLG